MGFGEKRLSWIRALAITLGLTAAACIGGKQYQEIPGAELDYEGARAICESYLSPPFYHMCWALKRPTCQQGEQALDQCMEQRGWKRVR